MITFLPYPSYIESAKCLDYKRLGKQRVEAKQILDTLLGKSDGWKNHPAVKMWRGHEYALCYYGIAMCIEWQNRGYVDNLEPYFVQTIYQMENVLTPERKENPVWLGDPRVHDSHRSMLLQKFPEHYRQFNWTVPQMRYFWPTGEED